jgi:hypothetical protein
VEHESCVSNFIFKIKIGLWHGCSGAVKIHNCLHVGAAHLESELFLQVAKRWCATIAYSLRRAKRILVGRHLFLQPVPRPENQFILGHDELVPCTGIAKDQTTLATVVLEDLVTKLHGALHTPINPLVFLPGSPQHYRFYSFPT